uniref:Uncharacterized protein n=1 Tax=Rhizophora mucronata TaxID=61149 RepID=A0A2P2IYP3_RHIMU
MSRCCFQKIYRIICCEYLSEGTGHFCWASKLCPCGKVPCCFWFLVHFFLKAIVLSVTLYFLL